MNRFTTRRVRRALFFLFAVALLVPNAPPLFAQQNNAASTRETKIAAPTAASTRAALGDNSVSGATPENVPAVARIAPLENPQVTGALQGSGVYVEPSMRDMAPPQRIVAALRAATGNRLPVDVLVMPSSWLEKQSADGYAVQLLAFMRRENGLAIVVAGREIGFAGEEVDDATRADIVKGAARTFDSESYAAGIAQIAADLAARRASRNASRWQLVGVALGLLLGGAYWLFRRRRRAVQLATNTAREQVKELAKKLAPRCKNLGADLDYALLGEDDETRRALLQTHQTRVRESLARARRRIESAQTLADWNSAQAELENVSREYSRARNALQHLPEDFEADESSPHIIEVPPLGSDLAGARVGFALDFFTSQPVVRRKMVPVDLTVGTQQRRVWAARETAARVLAGDSQIAVMDYGSGKRAWFDVPHFDAWKNENESPETLPLAEIAASMTACQQHLGGGYIGFGRGERGWFAPDYSGWNGGARHVREYSQTLENAFSKDAPQRAIAPPQAANAVEEKPTPREPREQTGALDAT